MNEHETTPEHHEAAPRDGPRIYVASLTDYNHGVLHGNWIDADVDPEVMQDGIDTMLSASPTARATGERAEEWAIHDYDGFGPIRIDEHEALSSIARWTDGIERHGAAYAAWIAHVGERSDEAIEQFEDRYQGLWESVEAYAEYMLDELDAHGVVNEAPEWLQPYLNIDVQGFARDLEIGGDIVTAETPEGGVWVWSGW